MVIVDTENNKATFKPHRIGNTNENWQTDDVLEGNKIMNANFYIQDDALVGSEFTFTGNVSARTLDHTG